MWKFSKLKDTNSTHSLYMYGNGIQCANVPHYTGVGHCIVYFSLGLSTTFKQIFEINSTLSFLYNLTILELYGNIADTNNNLYYYEKTIYPMCYRGSSGRIIMQ